MANANPPIRPVRINVEDENKLKDWSERFGVSEETLKEAIAKAGPMAQDVAKELRKPLR
jgi:hypothetical protein